MARLARIVAPGVPHHITQRGNRRQRTFFNDDDYRAYRALMAEWCAARGVAVWAYCLMPNHVHLIATPETAEALARAIGEAHRRYTRRINEREDWTGFLWQGRFASCPLDETHLLTAARYVEQNPMRAHLVRRAEDWPWSSARAHLAGRDDELVTVKPLLEIVPDWASYLETPTPEPALDAIRRHQRTGRPLGGETFIDALEVSLGRKVRPRKRGRKSRETSRD